MGIFDKGNKKKKDEFDGPVEEIDLSTGSMAGEAPPQAATEAAAPSEAPPPRPRPSSNYGIDDAIQLMRTLPSDNVELVVRVVKSTLESTNIEIKAIIEDASGKQKRIEDRVSVLKAEIADLEKEIQGRKTEIEGLEADHSETTQVKERLLLAEKLGTGAAPKASTSSTGSGPFGKTGSEPPRPRRSSTTPPPAPGSGTKTTVVSKK